MSACEWPGCAEKAAAWCKTHWFQLPQEIRAAIARSFPGREARTVGYLKAAGEARRWILATFDGPVVRERYEPAKWERLVRDVRARDEARARRRAAQQLEIGLAKPAPFTPATRCLP